MRLRPLFALSLFASLTLGLAAQPAAPDDPSPLIGQVEGNTYISPTGAFRVPVPILPELGGDITDTPNVVTFVDAFTTHIAIAAIPLDATQRWELSTRGKKDYLVQFFANTVLNDFRQAFPGSSVESAKFLSSVQDGALLVYALMPGGSKFNYRIALLGERDKIPTAKRGNLLFVKNDYVFIISSEISERVTERSLYTKTTAEEDEILRQRLLGILGTMRFAAPAVPTPATKP